MQDDENSGKGAESKSGMNIKKWRKDADKISVVFSIL